LDGLGSKGPSAPPGRPSEQLADHRKSTGNCNVPNN
jgi:hypothetical protein